MRTGYERERVQLTVALASFEAGGTVLAGLTAEDHRVTLVEQLIDSLRRQRYFLQVAERTFGKDVGDPRTAEFDPVKAAVLHRDAGRFDEACWMLFLFVHFGKHRRAGWSWPRAVYGDFGAEPVSWWTWERTSSDPVAFQYWLQGARPQLQALAGGFGNHRKYESLDPFSTTGTGAAVAGYVSLVVEGGGSHAALFSSLADPNPEVTFDRVMMAVRTVPRFGRTAGFDYVTTAARLGLLLARAPHTYMTGATGPLRGTRLLFLGGMDEAMTGREAQAALVRLAAALAVGPEVLEDAVCNWQKSPGVYRRFSG